MPTRPPEEVWRQLVDEAGEDDIEEAARVSPEQAERDLAAAGFDVEAEKASAQAFLDELAGRGPVATQAPPVKGPEKEAEKKEDEAPHVAVAVAPPRVDLDARRRRPSRVALWLVAAAAVAAVVGEALYTLVRPAVPLPATSTSVPSAPPSFVPQPVDSASLVTAADLRRRARVAIEGGHPGDCLKLLDRARELDPAGDRAPDVDAMRERARLALEDKP